MRPKRYPYTKNSWKGKQLKSMLMVLLIQFILLKN